MNKEQLAATLEAQQEVITQVALAKPLTGCLDSICNRIESILDDPLARSSILLLDGDQLRHGAAPHLPKAYCDAIDGVVIGPSVGSCGTAVFTRQQVIVSDIEADPLWANFAPVALAHDLRACWSTPIFSSRNEVLGSFAIYYKEPKEPDSFHLELIKRFTMLSGLAIEKDQWQRRETSLVTELKASNEKFSSFTSVMPDLALILGEDGRFWDCYGADTDRLFRNNKSLVGHNLYSVFAEETAARIMASLRKALESDRIEKFEFQVEKAGETRSYEGRFSLINNYLASQPERRHLLWMVRDITDQKLAERQIEKLAFFDPLTSLPNRRLLLERLQQLIIKAHRNHLYGALLYLDLDDFKRINDSLGHSVGDKLLVMVADRIRPLLRDSDIFARIGGDEFIVILEAWDRDMDIICDEASEVAKKIIRSFDYGFTLDQNEYRIGVSIGISIINEAGLSADEALKRADTAMYRSKSQGGRHYTFFDPNLQQILDDRLQLEKAIIDSIKENHFCAYFQPQIGLHGELLGAEALIRWQHPERGFVSPMEFIPVAEKMGLINQLQEVVLRDSCKLILALKERNLVQESFCIAVNISAVQFSGSDLKESLLHVMSSLGVTAREIKLEITESMLIDNIDFTIAQMAELKEEGFRFSIDDFGTGYSSLTYLQTFPIDELKIDKSFVDNIHSTDVGTGIVDAIIALSHHLSFSVIVEGVETPEQAAVFREREVKGMQGYYFSKPLSAQDLTQWLQHRI